MKDDLDPPSPVVVRVDAAAPPVALEYQPPQPPQRRGDMGWGLLIGFFLAMGVGWFIFGALMMLGHRDDHAGPIAVGAAFMTLGAATAGTLVWTRRPQHQQQRLPDDAGRRSARNA